MKLVFIRDASECTGDGVFGPKSDRVATSCATKVIRGRASTYACSDDPFIAPGREALIDVALKIQRPVAGYIPVCRRSFSAWRIKNISVALILDALEWNDDRTSNLSSFVAICDEKVVSINWQRLYIHVRVTTDNMLQLIC
jgi:hypothetical protein